METDTRALENYRMRGARAAVLGLGAVIAGSVVATAFEDLGMIVVIFGLMSLGLGLVGIERTVRIRRMVDKQGWRVRKARFGIVGGGNGQPALVLLASPTEPEAILSVSTTVFRWGALSGADEVWLTGNPQTRFAAVGTSGFGAIIVVKRPLLPLWRARLRRIALDAS